MSSTKTSDWWRGEPDWETPAGQLLRRFFATLPPDRTFHFVLYGSAPLQLTLNRTWTSADVDFSPTTTRTTTNGFGCWVLPRGRPTSTSNPVSA